MELQETQGQNHPVVKPFSLVFNCSVELQKATRCPAEELNLRGSAKVEFLFGCSHSVVTTWNCRYFFKMLSMHVDTVPQDPTV